MFWFFTVILTIGLLGLIVSIVLSTTSPRLLTVWLITFIICLILIVCGGIGVSIYQSIEENNLQEGCVENNGKYNYCPHCGQFLK